MEISKPFKEVVVKQRNYLDKGKRVVINARLELVKENARQNSRYFFREIGVARNGYKPSTRSILRKENSNDLITYATEVLIN